MLKDFVTRRLEGLAEGAAWEDFVKLVKRVRAKIPGIPLWANECCGTITGAKAGGEGDAPADS